MSVSKQLVAWTMAALSLGGTAYGAQYQESVPAKQKESERLICRRIQDSHSSFRVIRQCFTRAEWDRIAEAARFRTIDMQDRHTGGQ